MVSTPPQPFTLREPEFPGSLLQQRSVLYRKRTLWKCCYSREEAVGIDKEGSGYRSHLEGACNQMLRARSMYVVGCIHFHSMGLSVPCRKDQRAGELCSTQTDLERLQLDQPRSVCACPREALARLVTGVYDQAHARREQAVFLADQRKY